MIQLRYTTVDEKRKVFEWLFQSDTTSQHIGPPHYPDKPIPDWEEFLEEFEEHNFTPEGRSLSSVLMIMEENGEELGNVCYSLFHVSEGVAELDIWLKSQEVCGKGYGPQALRTLMKQLVEERNIHTFIIRPSIKNFFAVKAYEKAGFTHAIDKREAVKKYLRPEYIDLYGEGDYGMEESTFMICLAKDMPQ